MKTKIKKGVIAAAGTGTRFLPVVKEYPKELVPILSKPNIQYLVEEMIGAGITEIAIVHRHGNPLIKKYFTPNKELEKTLKETGKEYYLDSLRLIWKKVKKFRFIPQPHHLPYGNATPVLAAKGFVGNDSFVYMYGDDLILEKNRGGFLKKKIELFLQYKADVVAAADEFPIEESKKYSSIQYKKGGRFPYQIDNVVEKVEPQEAPSNMTLVGRFIVGPRVFTVLKNQKISRGELWFTETVQQLAKEGLALAYPVKKGQARWLTTGDPLRWLKVNIEVALQNPEIGQEVRSFLKEKCC